jgi:hypothetical protein
MAVASAAGAVVVSEVAGMLFIDALINGKATAVS